jgi:hypothetical protein
MHQRPDWKGDPDDRTKARADAARADEAFADILQSDAGQLRLTPDEVVHRLRLITFAATHPLISDGRTMTAEEIVDFALDGVRIHEPGDR